MRRGILLPPNKGRQILAPTQVKSTGRSGQIRQGRVLTPADFTDQGLTAPRALWNLGGLTDASGNGVTLTNGGGVTFGSGITGATTEAALFNGNGASGFLTAPNSIKQAFGTWGLWFRATPTQFITPAGQILMSMFRTAADFAFELGINPTKELYVNLSSDGSSANFVSTQGYGASILDDIWHFVCFTWDGSQLTLYVDGYQIGSNTSVTGTYPRGPAWTGGTGLLYLGAHQLDTATPFMGRIDEAFVTDQILKPHHMDYLRAVKIAHGLPSPRLVTATRRHYDKTATLVSGDFTSQPLVGYNFLTGALTTDGYGSLGKTLTAAGSPTECPSPDGNKGGVNFVAASNQSMGASDASLPSGAASRTIGAMVKRRVGVGFESLFGYGNGGVAGQEVRIDFDSAGRVRLVSGTVVETQTYGIQDDMGWTWLHWVYDNAHPAGVKTKLYINGACHGAAPNTLNTTLLGAGRFRIAESGDGTANGDLSVQNLYITNYAQQPEEIRGIVDKQGDLIGVSQVPTDDFLVDIDSTYVYCIFTGVSPRDSIELMVEN